MKAASLETHVSDHLPLVVWPNVSTKDKTRRRFKFENIWLKERNCRELVANCWDGTRSFQLMDKLLSCSKAIWEWGKKATKFSTKIELLV